ncbi:MAG: hypothetical protein AAFZ18_34025 [Myxococcota bacterium]
MPPRLAGRWWLEDDRGVRYADFHSAAGQNLVLTLVPREAYFLRNEKEQVVLPVRVSRTADASQFRRRRLTLAARGGPARAFREDLFAVPFGAAWMDGYRASQSSLTASAEAPSLDPGWGVRETSATILFSGAGVAAVAAVLLALDADAIATEHRGAVGSRAEIESLRGRASDRATTANVLLGVAGALLGAGALTLAW